jgi:O-antigen/teichoic acid export membrane protein
MAMSAVIYALLVGLAYPTAAILDMPALTELAPSFFLIVPLGALGIIQQTVLTREFDFRRMSVITFASTVGSGAVAVGLAFAGFGVWALVGQRVAQALIRTLLFWIFGRWRPQLIFSAASICAMFAYSSRLLGTDLLGNIFNNVPQFIIGGIHKGTLGVYDTARKVRDLPLTATMNSMQAVTFPALATLADDPAGFRKGVGKVVGSMAFGMFPMMAGLIMVAGELFGLFLKAEWAGAIPFFRILCLAGFAKPLAVISSNILRTRSDGNAVLRAEIIKKAAATVILAATIPFGAMPIAWGVVGMAFTDAAVSFVIARRHVDYGFGALARDTLPTLGLTLAMAAAVWGVGVLAGGLPLWAILAIKILTGAGIYLGGAALLRLDAFGEFTALVRRVINRPRSA